MDSLNLLYTDYVIRGTPNKYTKCVPLIMPCTEGTIGHVASTIGETPVSTIVSLVRGTVFSTIDKATNWDFAKVCDLSPPERAQCYWLP